MKQENSFLRLPSRLKYRGKFFHAKVVFSILLFFLFILITHIRTISHVNPEGSLPYLDRYHESEFYKNNKAALGSNPFDINTTIDRLKKFNPMNTATPGIEKNIFQMWKKRPEECNDEEFPHIEFLKRWRDINQDYKHHFYKNAELKDIMRETFKETVPEVFEAYDLLPKLIMESDFSRYLIVFLMGGVYSDLDVRPHKPVNEWFDSVVDNEINMLIAAEADRNEENWQEIMPRRLQITQWTFKAKKGHPLLARLIAKIVKYTFEAKYSGRLDPPNIFQAEILEWTGPAMFTDSIYEHFNANKDVAIVDFNRENLFERKDLKGPQYNPLMPIDWRLLTGIVAPIIVDDVAVLPTSGFRARLDCPDYCYARHFFSGSWKSEND